MNIGYDSCSRYASLQATVVAKEFWNCSYAGIKFFQLMFVWTGP